MDQWEQSPVGTTLGTLAGQLSSRPITDDILLKLVKGHVHPRNAFYEFLKYRKTKTTDYEFSIYGHDIGGLFLKEIIHI